MFLFFFVLSNSYLFELKKVNLAPGAVIQRHVDTLHSFILTNFSLLNVPANKTLLMYAFEEARRSVIFPNKTNHMAICCPNNSSFCKKGTIYFENIAPVLKKTIHSAKAREQKISNIVLQQISDFELPRKGLWTILIANCGQKNITVDGSAFLKKYDGSLDMRIKNFYTISILVIIVGVGMIAYNLFMWTTTLPKMLFEHKLMLLLISLFSINGVTSLLFFSTWNKTGEQNMILLVSDAFLRAFSTVCTYIFTLKQLQKPQENGFWLVFLALIPMFLGTYIENKGISNFSEIQTGRWCFGFGFPCVEFITKVALHTYVFIYAQVKAPLETSNENRKTLLGIVFGTLSSFVVMNLTLFIWRFGKNVVETRTSEWVPYTFHAIFMTILLSANAWHVGEYNPEGWETLNSLEDKSEIYYVKRPNKQINKAANSAEVEATA